MGKIHRVITPELQAWNRAQRMFFVATGPLSADGHLNCSPKGGNTFRVLGDREVAYLDLTGSGIETISHIQENGRIVIMFCAFEGAPKILRLHGKASVIYPNDSEFPVLKGQFPSHSGGRAIVKVLVRRISDSCGYAVPRLDFVEDRNALDKWTESKGPEALAAYRREKNAASIDDLPGYKPR
jgi:hypothetical protein